MGTSPSLTFIPWSGSTQDLYCQGTVTFESGANVGISRTVRQSTSSGLALQRPLDYLPAVGNSARDIPQDHGHLPKPVQQPRQLPRLSLRAAA